MFHTVVQKLRSRALVPAALVTFVLAAVLFAPGVGASLRPFLVNSYPCTALVATAAPTSPQVSGTAITITGTATCPNPTGAQYEFWYLAQGSNSWQLVQGYSASNTFNWNSTGAVAGIHVFSVWVRSATSTGVNVTALGSYDAFGNTSYTLTAAPVASCASVTAAAAPTSPQAAGTSITITATAGTCTHSTGQLYQFWYLGQGSSTWQMVQGYSTSNTFTWNSTGALAGNHVFSVWIRDSASAGLNSSMGSTYDAFGNTTMVITTPSCASVTLAAVPASPIAHGTTSVVFTATAGSCTHSTGQLYEFWYLGQGSSTWQLVRGYSTVATLTWNTTGALAGTHHWSVWIRDSASPGTNAAMGSTYDAFASLAYVLS